MFEKKEPMTSEIILGFNLEHMAEDTLRQKYTNNPDAIMKLCDALSTFSRESKSDLELMETFLKDKKFMVDLIRKEIERNRPQYEALKKLCGPDIVNLKPKFLEEYEQVEQESIHIKKQIEEADRIIAILEKVHSEKIGITGMLKTMIWGTTVNTPKQESETKKTETGFGGMKKGFL